MNIGAISNLLPNWAQSQSNTTGSASSTGGLSLAALAAHPGATAQISPAAQFMSMLQQIQQQNPDQFKQVAAKLAAGLEKQAQSDGNSAGAAQLNQLAADFQNSAKTGQLPPIQDLQAMGAAAHNQHHPIVNLLSGILGTAGAALG